MIEFVFDVVVDVLSRPCYGLIKSVLPWANGSPCFCKIVEGERVDVFAIQTHQDADARELVYDSDLLAVADHFGFDATAVFREVREAGGELLAP